MKKNFIKPKFPQREVCEIKNDFSNLLELKHGSGEGAKLDDVLIETLDNEKLNQDIKTTITFILSNKMDCASASYRSQETITYNKYKVNSFSVNSNLFNIIKKKSIIRSAKQAGIWKSSPFLKNMTIGNTIPLVIGIAGIILDFAVAISSNIENGKFLVIICSIIGTLSLSLFLFFFFKYFVDKRNDDYDKFIGSLENDSMFSFIEKMSIDDYSIAKTSLYNNEVFMVENFERLSKMQQKILVDYLAKIPKNSQKQNWFIFLEDEEILKNLYSSIKLCKKNMYYIKPFTMAEKKVLIIQNNLNEKMLSAKAMKIYGIDFLLNDSIYRNNYSNEEILTEVNIFINGLDESYNYNMFTLIYFISDLLCSWEIDSKETTWKTIFSNHNQNIQKNVTSDEKRLDKLLFIKPNCNIDWKHLQLMVLKIVKKFNNSFVNIYSNSEIKSKATTSSSEYYQLLIIKALKHAESIDTRYLIITNQKIYDLLEIDYINDKEVFSRDDQCWFNIFNTLIKIDLDNNFYYYLPFLIHSMIDIFGEIDNYKKLLNNYYLLNAARINIVIDPDDEYDVIYDHYRLLKIFSKCSIKNENNHYPASFGLLYMNNVERYNYYICLLENKENLIISYYDLIFNFFCSSFNNTTRNYINMLCSEAYDNNLEKKYEYYHGNDSIVTYDYYKYITYAIKELVEVINKAIANDMNIQLLIGNINRILNLNNTCDHNQEIMLNQIECELYGSGTLIIISKIIAILVTESQCDTNLTLEIGNDILKIIYYNIYFKNNFMKYGYMQMVDLLIKYENPSNIIKATMAQTLKYTSLKCISIKIKIKLLNDTQSIYNNLLEMISLLKKEEIEDYILNVRTSSFLSEDEKTMILKKLRERVARDFNQSTQYNIIEQLTSIILDKKISSMFDKNCEEHIIDTINKYNPNMVYFLYEEYIKIDEDNFLKYCPKVTKKILKSSILQNTLVVYKYLNKYKECKSTNEYIATYMQFFERIENDPPVNSYLIITYLNFFDENIQIDQIDSQKIVELKEHLRRINSQIMKEEAKDFINIEYGIISYLKALINKISTMENITISSSSNNYLKLSNREIISNVLQKILYINLFVEEKPYKIINYEYICILDLISKDENLKEKLKPIKKDIIAKLAKDSIYIIENILAYSIDENSKRQIIGLINNYVDIEK